jgi:hypothetical protein
VGYVVQFHLQCHTFVSCFLPSVNFLNSCSLFKHSVLPHFESCVIKFIMKLFIMQYDYNLWNSKYTYFLITIFFTTWSVGQNGKSLKLQLKRWRFKSRIIFMIKLISKIMMMWQESIINAHMSNQQCITNLVIFQQ